MATSNGLVGDANFVAELQFTSLSAAQVYIEQLVGEAGSLINTQICDALAGLRRAYCEFPELDLNYPRFTVSQRLLSAIDKGGNQGGIDNILVLISIIQFNSSSKSLVCLKRAVEEFMSAGVKSFSAYNASDLRTRIREAQLVLRGRHQPDTLHLRVPVAEALARMEIAALGNIVEDGEATGDEKPVSERLLAVDDPGLLGLIPSVRQRLGERCLWERDRQPRDELLVIAARINNAVVQRRQVQRRLAWPSGRLSFNEFVLQWPCRIELPAEIDDDALIVEVYRAILLRNPTTSEVNQCHKLLHSGEVNIRWIIEDLLGSSEFHALERMLEVVWSGEVLSRSGDPNSDLAPTIAWPSGGPPRGARCVRH